MDTTYTVVIPAFNAAKTLAETIDSALAQSIRPAKVIVVDDGSTDDTRAVAEGHPGGVLVLAQSNQGPGAAMSLGMRFCTTPLIAAIDSDDLWLPDKIEKQLEYLRRHPECRGVFCQMRHFGDGVVEGAVQDGWGRSTMLIYRDVFTQIGDVVDPPGRRGEMIDWLARAREANLPMTLLPEVLALRRISPTSLSAGRDTERDRSYAQVAIAALRRKRALLEGASKA